MDNHCVGLPGAFNGLVARAVAAAGFEGCYVSGAAVSACRGVPDVGLVSLNEFCDVIRQVADGSGLPVLADADTGFGESEMVTRAVWEDHRAGAAGLHIEDQVFPKRCGHLDGKALISIEHMQEKVSRAAIARNAIGEATGTGIPYTTDGQKRGPMIICARTDAAGVEGLDRAIERAKAYLDAGADMIFPEGLTNEKDFARFAREVINHHAPVRTSMVYGYGYPPPYMLANMTEFGKTPIIPLKRFAEMGYSCVIWPVTTLRAAMGEVTRILGDLKRDGDVSASVDRMQHRKDLYGLIGYTPGNEWQFPAGTGSR